jgi:hypothetical protein
MAAVVITAAIAATSGFLVMATTPIFYVYSRKDLAAYCAALRGLQGAGHLSISCYKSIDYKTKTK